MRCALVLFAVAAACDARGSRVTVAEAAPAPQASGSPTRLALELVADDLTAPVGLETAPDDPRLFVVEQRGRILALDPAAGPRARPTLFVDLSKRVSCCGERGLLGLAFARDFGKSRRFFVHYTDRKGDTQVSELRAAWDGRTADPASEKHLWGAGQPYSNHNGGQLAFGPDGMLYLGLGDGGSGGDPHGNGQRLDTPLGKLLRFDVSVPGRARYAGDNPFVGRSGARAEIWAYGLRNPWRFSFDAPTGDLYIADVGQNKWEWVHVARAGAKRLGAAKGFNFGWSIFEGNHCFGSAAACRKATGISQAVAEYPHPQGCSITGGHVYRGKRMPALMGTYFYSDYCTSFLRSFRLADGKATEARDWTKGLRVPAGRNLDSVSAFGLGNDGEIYLVDHQGEIYRLAPG
jgi:glucose/arabinose dehydrogenase